MVGEGVEAVVDPVPSAAVIEKCLAVKIGICKRRRRVKLGYRDARLLEVNVVINTSFKVIYVQVQSRDLHYNSSDLYPKCIIKQMITQ